MLENPDFTRVSEEIKKNLKKVKKVVDIMLFM